MVNILLTIKSLCVVLPQMSECMKYFDNSGRNMSFKIEGDNGLVKYNDIWKKIKRLLDIRFHCKPVYTCRHIKIKVKAFNGVMHTIFYGDKIPKQGVLNICIAAINIDCHEN